MDIDLPAMRGIEGVGRIRAISPATQIFNLLVSGKPQKQIVEALFSASSDCHPPKKHLRQAARTLPQRGGGQGAERASRLSLFPPRKLEARRKEWKDF
jgi:hypothetical protein